MTRGISRKSAGAMGVILPILAALLMAPFFFGGTTGESALLLDGLCFLSLAFGVLTLIWKKKNPSIPKLVWIPLLSLSLLGGLHILFPHYRFDADSWTLISLGEGRSWLPGTVDRSTSLEAYRHFLAIAAALLVLVVVSRQPSARWWVLRVIALSGVAIALVGIGQKAGGAEQMLWSTKGESGHLFFGAFRYHGNAAAFLNLCWPASLALWLRFGQEAGEARKSFWLAALVITVAGVFVNSSKAGHVIATLFLIVAAIRFWKQLPFQGRSWASAAAGGLVLLLFVGIVVAPGAATTLEKWDEVIADGSTWKGRVMASQVCLSMLPDSGLWGSGPGTFRLVFPFYTHEAGENFRGFWYHAHQDYLQTWIEWGLVGFLLFGIVLVGGVTRGIRKVRRMRQRRIPELSTSCALLAIGTVTVHALADFPLQIPAIQLLVVAFLSFFLIKEKARKKQKHHAISIDARMQHTGVNRVRRDLETV